MRAYVEQINDPDSRNLIKLIYVSSPKVTVTEYLVNLNRALSKSKDIDKEHDIDSNLGNLLTSYRLLEIFADSNSASRKYLEARFDTDKNLSKKLREELESVTKIIQELQTLPTKDIMEMLSSTVSTLDKNSTIYKELIKIQNNPGSSVTVRNYLNRSLRRFMLQSGFLTKGYLSTRPTGSIIDSFLNKDKYYDSSSNVESDDYFNGGTEIQLDTELGDVDYDGTVVKDSIAERIKILETDLRAKWNGTNKSDNEFGIYIRLPLAQRSQKSYGETGHMLVISEVECDTSSGKYLHRGLSLRINGKLDTTQIILNIAGVVNAIYDQANKLGINKHRYENPVTPNKENTKIKIVNTLRLAGTSNEVIEEIMKNVTINEDDEINNELWNKIYNYVRVRYPAYKMQSGITITGIKIYESKDKYDFSKDHIKNMEISDNVIKITTESGKKFEID